MSNKLLARIVFVMGAAFAPGAWADGAVTQVVPRNAPLVDAVRARDAALALKLLRAGPRDVVRQIAVDGTTALHWAVYNDNAELVDRLVAAGADVNARNDYGATPLSQAAVVGNVRVLKRLLSAGADVGVRQCRRPDRADGAGPQQQCGGGEAAAEAWREGGCARGLARADGADVGCGRRPARHGEAADRAGRRRERPQQGEQLGAPGHRRAAQPGATGRRLHAAAVCRAARLPGMRAAAGQRRCRCERRRSGRRQPAAAGHAEFQLRHGGVPDRAGRRREPLGHLGQGAAVCRGGHEHAAHRRPRGSTFARQDHGHRTHRQAAQGRRQPEPAAQAVPAASLAARRPRRRHAPDHRQHAADPRRKGGRCARDQAPAGRRRQCGTCDHQWHHAAAGRCRQRILRPRHARPIQDRGPGSGSRAAAAGGGRQHQRARPRRADGAAWCRELRAGIR